MKMKNVYLYVVLTVVLAATAAGLYYLGMHHASASYNCVAGPNELCASDQFHSDRLRVKELDKEITEQTKSGAVRSWQDKIDLRNGLAERLNAQMDVELKQGYNWNDDKGRFVCPTNDCPHVQGQVVKQPDQAQPKSVPVKPTTVTPAKK
jgi:hypothetical protein